MRPRRDLPLVNAYTSSHRSPMFKTNRRVPRTYFVIARGIAYQPTMFLVRQLSCAVYSPVRSVRKVSDSRACKAIIEGKLSVRPSTICPRLTRESIRSSISTCGCSRGPHIPYIASAARGRANVQDDPSSEVNGCRCGAARPLHNQPPTSSPLNFVPS